MKKISPQLIAALVISLTSMLVISVSAQDKEQRVRLKDIPPAVQKTVQEQTQGATIRSISKEKENGKTVYEIETKVNGHSRDLMIEADGTLGDIEEEVAISALPKAVKDGLLKLVGKGKIVKIESVTKNNAIAFYEAAIKKQGKVSEVKIGTDGQPIAK